MKYEKLRQMLNTLSTVADKETMMVVKVVDIDAEPKFYYITGLDIDSNRVYITSNPYGYDDIKEIEEELNPNESE